MTPLTQTRSEPAERLRRALAAFCVLLILLVGAAHLLHTHPNQSAEDAGCSLCVVAHLAAVPVALIAGPVLAESVRFVTFATPALSPARSHALALRIRPPPVPKPFA